MYVVQYELKPAGKQPAGTPPANSVASINTHDMPTFAAFWNGEQAAMTRFLKARRLLQGSESDTIAILEGLLRFLASSDAEIVLVNLEDLWLEREPQNMPGVPERSWRHRTALSLEEMQNDATVNRLLKAVDQARRKAHGRKK